jgi:hypothetical protein
MRKLIVLLAVAIVLTVSFSSCQGGKKCPAYSQIKTEQVKNNS